MRRFASLLSLLPVVGCASSAPVEAPVAIALPAPAPTESIESLRAMLRSPDPANRSRAAMELAGATSADEQLVADLERLLDDDHRKVRYAASWALGFLTRSDYFDEPPTLEHQTQPTYPRAAFTKMIQGTVVLQVLIGEEGEVAHAAVLQSIPILDASALACVEQWRFRPARRRGRDVPIAARAPVTFRIYVKD